jgi:hypothetical protein
MVGRQINWQGNNSGKQQFSQLITTAQQEIMHSFAQIHARGIVSQASIFPIRYCNEDWRRQHEDQLARIECQPRADSPPNFRKPAAEIFDSGAEGLEFGIATSASQDSPVGSATMWAATVTYLPRDAIALQFQETLFA